MYIHLLYNTYIFTKLQAPKATVVCDVGWTMASLLRSPPWSDPRNYHCTLGGVVIDQWADDWDRCAAQRGLPSNPFSQSLGAFCATWVTWPDFSQSVETLRQGTLVAFVMMLRTTSAVTSSGMVLAHNMTPSGQMQSECFLNMPPRASCLAFISVRTHCIDVRFLSFGGQGLKPLPTSMAETLLFVRWKLERLPLWGQYWNGAVLAGQVSRVHCCSVRMGWPTRSWNQTNCWRTQELTCDGHTPETLHSDFELRGSELQWLLPQVDANMGRGMLIWRRTKE